MTLQLEIQNIGGIESDSVEFSSGLTVLSGENATNRTSIINSLMAAMGSDRPAIRTGAEEGYVSLRNGSGTTYERTVKATSNGSVWSGDGATENPDQFHLFSCLLRDNDIRRAVAEGGDLYDFVMSPVDTAEIEAKIEELKSERNQIQDREAQLDAKRDEKEQLADEIEAHQEEIAELESELEEIEEEIAAIDETETQSDQLEKTDELNEKLRDLTSTQNELETALEKHQDKLKLKRDQLASLQSSEFADVDELADRKTEITQKLGDLQEEIEQLETDKAKLTPLRRALNRLSDSETTASEINRLSQKYADFTLFESVPERDDPTESLVETPSKTVCLLTGAEIDSDHYQKMLQEINEVITSITNQHDAMQEEMDALRDEKSEIESKKREVEQNKDRIAELETEIEELEVRIEDTEAELETVSTDREELEAEIEDLKQEVVEETEDKTSELSELKSDQTQTELRIETLEDKIGSKEAKIERLRDEIEEIEADLSTRLPEINAELDSLKGKVEAKEREVVEEFNDTMEDILTRLQYDSVERVWIEKTQTTVQDGRSQREKPVFNLNIVRDVDGVGTADEVSNLSESEQTVTALILALTGYIVHDVASDAPVVLMDSVEMIDAGRLEELLKYMVELDPIEHVVVTALPEDVDVMDIEGKAVVRR